jgi:hypothetical protein
VKLSLKVAREHKLLQNIYQGDDYGIFGGFKSGGKSVKTAKKFPKFEKIQNE